MRGIVKRVWPKNERGPGSVVFNDDSKLSTFSDVVLNAARGLVGQEVEYTVERNGKYTNLASVAPVNGGSNGSSANQTSAPAPVTSAPADTKLLAAAERIAKAVEAVAANLVKIVFAPTAHDIAPPASEPATPSIEAKQALLAEAVGSEDAAAAMFDALKKKHATKPDALVEAIDKLLKGHGVTVGAEVTN